MSTDRTIKAVDDLNGFTFGTTAHIGEGSAAVVLRGIILNGTNQNAHRTLPNSSPFTSMPAFKFDFRIRNAASTSGGFIFQMRNSGESPQFELTNGNGATQLAFNDYRDGVSAYIIPNTYSDFKMRVQYDPSNSRWTLETWDSDDTDRVQSTVGITTTTNWSLGSGLWTMGSGYYDSSYLAQTIDYFRWDDTVVALNSTPPSDPFTAGPTYRARWEFENDGIDSAAVAGNLTLSNSPTYENTP